MAGELESEFIELITQVGKAKGLDQLTAKVFAILYIEPKEISLENLSKITGYSISSIWNSMKKMEFIGYVKRIKKPGSKKIYLYAEKDLKKAWKEMMERMYKSNILAVKEKLPKIIEKNKAADKEKLKIIKGYYKQILWFDDIMKLVMKKIESEK